MIEKSIKIPTQTVCCYCSKPFVYLFTWFIGPAKVCNSCRKQGKREP